MPCAFLLLWSDCVYPLLSNSQFETQFSMGSSWGMRSFKRLKARGPPVKRTSGFRRQVGGSTCILSPLVPHRETHLKGAVFKVPSWRQRSKSLQALDFPASSAKRNEFLSIINYPGTGILLQQQLPRIITLLDRGWSLIVQLFFLPLPGLSHTLLCAAVPHAEPWLHNSDLVPSETLVLHARNTSQSFRFQTLFVVFTYS